MSYILGPLIFNPKAHGGLLSAEGDDHVQRLQHALSRRAQNHHLDPRKSISTRKNAVCSLNVDQKEWSSGTQFRWLVVGRNTYQVKGINRVVLV